MNPRLRVLALASVLLSLLAASGAPAARGRQVSLTVAINGRGAVWLSGGRQLACSTPCTRTVRVRAGSRMRLKAQPVIAWKFGGWAGACRGTTAVCTLRVSRAARVGVTFIQPGERTNPIPLGVGFAFGDGWVFKVVSATLDATAQFLAVMNSPPPLGAQYAMVSVSATYMGGGSSTLENLDGDRFQTMGAHNFPYLPFYGTIPPPVLPDGEVYSGQSISGNIGFEIASNDAGSLMLFQGDPIYGNPVWFALR